MIYNASLIILNNKQIKRTSGNAFPDVRFIRFVAYDMRHYN